MLSSHSRPRRAGRHWRPRRTLTVQSSARRRSPQRHKDPTLHSRAQAFDRKERARLQQHFCDVLSELGPRPTGHLRLEQQSARSRIFHELARYAARGRFPRNISFRDALVPTFVDVFGTRCAVAHLLESTGDHALVSRITATDNHKLVPQMAGNPALLLWLERVGLTLEEATRIQPSYCFITKAEACFCNSTGADAIMEGVVTGPAGDGAVTVRIDVIYGDPSLGEVGQVVEAYSSFPEGTKVLVQAHKYEGQANSYFAVFNIEGDIVIPRCGMDDLPAVPKDLAIEALFEPDISECAVKLTDTNDVWAESQCDEGGCSIANAGAVASTGPLATVIAAALVARARRWRRTRWSSSKTSPRSLSAR